MKLATVLNGLAIVGTAHTTAIATAALAVSDGLPNVDAVDLAARAVIDCELQNQVVAIIGTSRSLIIYISLSGVGSKAVCDILHAHGIGPPGTSTCQNYGIAIGSAVGLIFQGVQESQGTEAAPTGDTTKRNAPSLVDRLNAILDADQQEHGGVSSLPLSDIESRDVGNPPMLQHAKITGFRHGNSSSDFTIADFGSGNGHVYVQPHFNQSADSLAKRHTGPGFKIAFANKIPSKLTRAHQLSMASAIGDGWGQAADDLSAADYFGFVETGHYANFYLRIIPELYSYGSNYESVDVCGYLGSYL
ncbi:hypothetical protein LTR17_007915 [Elasticomyces elasticus]|nr:hypothetical protein LTR17_007915 [Elasticomyces elasticus]